MIYIWVSHNPSSLSDPLCYLIRDHRLRAKPWVNMYIGIEDNIIKLLNHSL